MEGATRLRSAELVDGVPGAGACRACSAPLEESVVDLGMSPLCESFLAETQIEQMEPFYPLHPRVCTSCWLVQIPQVAEPKEIFGEYAYFSSYSDSWVDHARDYAEMIVDRLGLGRRSSVIELASNDGYLLQHFLPRGIDVLGIDPARNVAAAAEARGVPTLTAFFGRDVALGLVAERGRADLVIGNNVLAQVPDINDFVAGVCALVAPRGTATFEFPHLMRLLAGTQYDTIYHEHFSYFSLSTVCEIFSRHGLTVVDVEELSTHGGSLRVYVMHEGAPASAAVATVLAAEEAGGLRDLATYHAFAADVHESKRALLELLLRVRRLGTHIVGYGAPGKGNTLLNYCGIRTDIIDYLVDRSVYKHGRYTPGTHIPIHPPERIAETRPEMIMILPWNLRSEIAAQLAYTAAWDATLLVPVPRPEVLTPGR